MPDAKLLKNCHATKLFDKFEPSLTRECYNIEFDDEADGF